MEQISNNTQNKTLETHNAQTRVSPTVESQIKVNRNRITKTDKRSDNRKIEENEESEENRSTFKLPTPQKINKTRRKSKDTITKVKKIII